MQNNFLLKIGVHLRLERERNAMTQAQLAEFAGLHYNYIGQLERGEKAATIISLHKICSALGVGVGDFLQQIGI